MSAAVISLFAPPAVPEGAICPAKPLALQLPRGRLVQLVGDRSGAHLSAAVGCLRHAQAQGETAAWIQPVGGGLYPPDLADNGIDLSALLVVHVPTSAGVFGLPKAAELLLRSGGFGLVVLDLLDLGNIEVDAPRAGGRGGMATQTPPPTTNARGVSKRRRGKQQRSLAGDSAWQGRLLGMAREHDAWLLLLSERDTDGSGDSQDNHHHGRASLGPLVSLCLHPTRTRCDGGQFEVTPEVWKDKSGSLGAIEPAQLRGPWGLV